MIPPWPDGASHTRPDAPMDHWLTTLNVQGRPPMGDRRAFAITPERSCTAIEWTKARPDRATNLSALRSDWHI